MKTQFPLLKPWLLLFGCGLNLFARSQYWQQKVDYTINVSLDVKEKTLDGFERIVYSNHSPDTLTFIWFHLWPNAYKNDKTAFTDQQLSMGNTDFYFSSREEKGYINRLDFKVDGITSKIEDHPQHIDIVRLLLPKPILPGGQIVITTPFHVKLPYNFSRGGFVNESFQVSQWYPKPAVYDGQGWHPMSYVDQGEFYSEFGNYDVQITVPKHYVVAATGELQNEDEKQWLKNRSSEVDEIKKSFAAYKKLQQAAKKPSSKPVKTMIQGAESKTLVFKQDNVHDFAWFADPYFLVDIDSCQLSSGKVVQVSSYYNPAEEPMWKSSVSFAKEALRFYSNEVGEYPYNVASVVQGPLSFGGGMEYPTITLIAPLSSSQTLDQIIAHELGHNWFYGALGNNERKHPWMDEGINTFYENKYMQSKYGISRANELLFQTIAALKKDQPIETHAEDFSEINYGAVAYHKTAEWLRFLEQEIGQDSFRQTMKRYYDQWRFKHPQPGDFEAIFQTPLKEKAASFFLLRHSKGILPFNEPGGFKVVSPLIKGSIKGYLNQPAKHILLVSPAAGINGYDKLMLGGLVSNFKLPPNRFQFFAVPMWGTASKKFTGIGKMNFTIMSGGLIRKTDILFNASKFSMNDFKDTAGRKLIMQFQKLVPGMRLTFRQKDPKSTVTTSLQWKTFFINEQSLRITPDTNIIGTDTSLFLHYRLPKTNRYLNQLEFVYKNNRGLYPFQVNFRVEQSTDFVRPTLTADYFFNYKDGGLKARFFAGKFIYIKEKTISRQFANDRYYLNMTGPNGYEDYTYSDYFFGRNRFEGTSSQQIMIRDGAFKVRTDLLASKVGKTDDWLTAANFVASLPAKLNPLSVLPVKIPLGIFLDVGTYAEAWERDADTDRFLYAAGLQLPLFGEMVDIYIPLLYNKVYGDYFKSTIPKNRFLKTISFSVQFYTSSIKEVNRITEF